MPDFDVFSLLEIRKRKSRSHGIRKKGNGKRKKRAVKRSNTSLKDLSEVLEDHGRHSVLSFLSSLPISVLRILDTEANKFYDRNHQLYDAALLTRCYTQHALRPFIDSETNHKRHFILNLLTYLVSLRTDPLLRRYLLISKILNHQSFVINITSPLETLYLISINLFLILTFMQTLLCHEIVKIPNLFILQPVI